MRAAQQLEASGFSKCCHVAGEAYACDCLESNGDGMKLALGIVAEKTKATPPDAAEYIDRSCLQQARKELLDARAT